MELVRLRGYADWSAPLLLAKPGRQVFSRGTQLKDYLLKGQLRRVAGSLGRMESVVAQWLGTCLWC